MRAGCKSWREVQLAFDLTENDIVVTGQREGGRGKEAYPVSAQLSNFPYTVCLAQYWTYAVLAWAV